MDDAKPPPILRGYILTFLGYRIYILEKSASHSFLDLRPGCSPDHMEQNEPETYLRFTPPSGHALVLAYHTSAFSCTVKLASAADECGDPNEKITLACKSYACPWRSLGRGDSQFHVFMRLKVKNAFQFYMVRIPPCCFIWSSFDLSGLVDPHRLHTNVPCEGGSLDLEGCHTPTTTT
jgi:hypothetical protein